MLVVALTGGIGSGKTTATERFAELGVPVIDADDVSRALTASAGEALPAIADAFGPEVFTDNGDLDRTALRRRVFADPHARRRLEGILHPRIRARMLAELRSLRAPYAILVIPLLFETGQTDLADRVLVIDLPEEEQIRRVSRRSALTAEEVRAIMASQVSRDYRLRHADDVIDNAAGPEALRAQVDWLHHRYLELAAGGGAAPGR